MPHDDDESLFGDDIDYEVEQPSSSRHALALPVLRGKSGSDRAHADGQSRVGNSALSVSPLPRSEHKQSAATTSSSATSSSKSSTNLWNPALSLVSDRTTKASRTAHRSNRKAGPADDEVSASSRPSKRARKSESKGKGRSLIHPEPPPSAFGHVLSILQTDATVVSHLETLLSHVKTTVELNVATGPASQREVSSFTDWRNSRTRDLTKLLASALKQALKRLTVGDDAIRESDFQAAVQHWIHGKLLKQITSTPSATPGPATPTTLLSPHVALHYTPLLDDTYQIMGPGLQGWVSGGSVTPHNSVSNPYGLGMEDPTGQTPEWLSQPFGFLEEILGMCQQSNPTAPEMSSFLNPIVSNFPSDDFLSSLSAPTADLPPLFSPGFPGLDELSNPLTWNSFPPAPQSQMDWLDPSLCLDPPPSCPTHPEGLDGRMCWSPTLTSQASHQLDAPGTSSLGLPVAQQDPQAPSSCLAHPSPSSESAIVDSSAPTRMDDPTNHINNISPMKAVPSELIQPKNPRARAILTKARKTRQDLQQSLDQALGSMWDLEIEHATLEKVLKKITEREAMLASKGKGPKKGSGDGAAS